MKHLTQTDHVWSQLGDNALLKNAWPRLFVEEMEYAGAIARTTAYSGRRFAPPLMLSVRQKEIGITYRKSSIGD